MADLNRTSLQVPQKYCKKLRKSLLINKGGCPEGRQTEATVTKCKISGDRQLKSITCYPPSLQPSVLSITNCSVSAKIKNKNNVTWSKLSIASILWELSPSCFLPLSYKVLPCHLSFLSNLFLLSRASFRDRNHSCRNSYVCNLIWDQTLICLTILQMAKMK